MSSADNRLVWYNISGVFLFVFSATGSREAWRLATSAAARHRSGQRTQMRVNHSRNIIENRFHNTMLLKQIVTALH